MNIADRIKSECCGVEADTDPCASGRATEELRSQLTRVLALVTACGEWVNGDDTPPNDTKMLMKILRSYQELEKHGDIPAETGT